MENNRNKIKVGVGVMIFKDNKVLMGKRKGSHGDGEYSFTGDHLEYMESFEECAKRETFEETGIKICNVKFKLLANIKRYEPKQYIHIGMIADWESGESQILEPDKVESWKWYDLDNLPSPIFYPAQTIIDSYKSGKNYYDKD